MTESQLIRHISAFNSRIQAVKFRTQLRDENFSLSQLVDLTFNSDKAVAQKASRILQFIMFKFPQNYLDEIGYLVQNVPNVQCPGCLKHYARIMTRITSPEVSKEVRNKLKEIDLDLIAGLCFKWLNETKMLTVVRASAAEALFNMRHRYPWIAEALSDKLESISNNAAPMLKTKAAYILSYLHCED